MLCDVNTCLEKEGQPVAQSKSQWASTRGRKAVCGQGTVEDLQHSLLECSAYGDAKQQFAPMFAPPHTTVAAVQGHQPQARLSAANCAIRLAQSKCLLSNSRHIEKKKHYQLRVASGGLATSNCPVPVIAMHKSQ